MTEFREQEVNQVSAALLSEQSVLVLGENGAGKTFLAEKVRGLLEGQGYSVAIARYSGSAKDTLLEICKQLNLPTVTGNKTMTATQLRETLLKNLPAPKTLLIIDDAHRFPASLRYWLEDCLRAGTLLLLVATAPPAKDIFLKLCRIEMQPLKNSEVRTLMYQEALAIGVPLDPGKFAELQQRAGNNPALAKRVVREALLGISEGASTDHQQYVDGTPFLVASLTIVGIVRFIGMGLGDKSLYILGGIAACLAIALRTIMFSVNRRSNRL